MTLSRRQIRGEIASRSTNAGMGMKRVRPKMGPSRVSSARKARMRYQMRNG